MSRCCCTFRLLPKGQALFCLLGILHTSVSVPGPHPGPHPIRGPWASPRAPPGPAGSHTYPDVDDGGSLGRKGSVGGPLTDWGEGSGGETAGRSTLSPSPPTTHRSQSSCCSSCGRACDGGATSERAPGHLLRGPVLSVHRQPEKPRVLASRVHMASPGWEKRVSPSVTSLDLEGDGPEDSSLSASAL